MKISEAKEIIYGGLKPTGYRVHFEKVDGSILTGCYVPDPDEPMFKYEAEAWEFAKKLADQTFDKFVNIYVVDQNWIPVLGYGSRKITNR